MFEGTVLELWRFPVKSMRGERVDALRIDRRGAGGDRTHAVWQHDKQLTAREAPRLLAWAARYDVPGADLHPAAPPVARLTDPTGHELSWEDPSLTRRLSEDLGRPIDLRRDKRGQQDLADSLLVTTDASLRALEQELPDGEEMLRRFRPNLHLSLDAPAWADLGWEGATMEFSGGVVLRLLHPCERCVIPTCHPDTQKKWPQLLRHLARAHGTQFGINARAEVAGAIRQGERVKVAPATGP
jgi:uncharacterized protein YcbX